MKKYAGSVTSQCRHNSSCPLATAYFCSTFLTFLPGRVLPFDFLKILPRLVLASPLPMVVPPVVIV